jgi:transcriptional regulator with XRE-family HTH domain
MTMSLGKRVRTIRKIKGLTQKELADKVSLSRTYLSMIENGVVEVSNLDLIRRLAHVLAVPELILLGTLAKRGQTPEEDRIFCLLDRITNQLLRVMNDYDERK